MPENAELRTCWKRLAAAGPFRVLCEVTFLSAPTAGSLPAMLALIKEMGARVTFSSYDHLQVVVKSEELIRTSRDLCASAQDARKASADALERAKTVWADAEAATRSNPRRTD